MPFKCDFGLQIIPLSKQPFKMQPQIENEDVTWSRQYNLPATRANKRRASSLQAIELDGWFLIFTLYCKHVPYNSCTTLTWVLYFTPIFLDWRLEFEQALQLKGCNLWTLHNETQMRASILNTAWNSHMRLAASPIHYSRFATRRGCLQWLGNTGCVSSLYINSPGLLTLPHRVSFPNYFAKISFLKIGVVEGNEIDFSLGSQKANGIESTSWWFQSG